MGTRVSLTDGSNAEKVVTVDATGAIVTGGGGGGTQYVASAAAAANPTGTVVNLVRADTPASIGSNGNNVSQRGDAYGAGYVELLNSSGAKLDYRNGPNVATQSSVASATTAGGVAILASNANRLGCTITNTDANALYLFYGATGSVSATVFNHLLLTNDALIIEPGEYTGAICGIWAAAGSGAAKVCEFS
jgi:hypothetical protein